MAALRRRFTSSMTGPPRTMNSHGWVLEPEGDHLDVSMSFFRTFLGTGSGLKERMLRRFRMAEMRSIGLLHDWDFSQ